MPVTVTISAPDVTFEGFDLHGAGEHAIEIKASHVSVRNVTVGIHRPAYEGDAIIEGIGVSNVTITDCMMQSTGGYGIYFQDSRDLAVGRNFVIVNNQSTEVRPKTIAAVFTPVEADYSGFLFENNTVIGGPIESSVIYPIEEESGTPYLHDIVIRNNTVSDNMGSGITVEGLSDISDSGELIYHLSNVTIQDNRVSDCEENFGIFVNGAADGQVSGNQVKNMQDFQAGMGIFSATRFKVLNNTISDCTGEDMFGLYLYRITASTVSGNLMDRNTYNFYYDNSENFTPMMDIDGTNLADGRPIRYYEGMDHFSVDGDVSNGAGYYFINCRDFSAARLTPSRMYQGVAIINCQNASLTHSTVEQCDQGIMVRSSSDSMIFTNELVGNNYGIWVSRFNNSMIWRNDIFNSTTSGIYITSSSPDLRINNNDIRDSFIGIFMSISPSSSNINRISVDGNEIQRCNRGLDIRGTKDLTVTNNVISDSFGSGIRLTYARDGMFSQNQIRNNAVGMEIRYLPGTLVAGNNTIVDNYFNNVNQVKIVRPVDAAMGGLFVDEPKDPPTFDEMKEQVAVEEEIPTNEVNYWNITKTSGTNIVGGPYLGGNYWASPDGTGFSETHADRGDGFCNESYVFDEWNTDYLPLHTYTPKPTFYADFTVSPTTGTVPLTVKCTDKSIGNPTRYVYNFGDGVNMTGPNPVHTYKVPGVYTITLTITKYNATSNSMLSSAATKTNVISVNSIPSVPLVSKFIASPVSGYAPMTVSFIDQSDGNPTFYNYDFGDGINGTGRNPVHTYQLPRHL